MTARPVYLPTLRDRTLHYLDTNIRAYMLFLERTRRGPHSALVQAVREACPELPRTYEDDVADSVGRALKARMPRMIRRARRAA